MTEQTLYGHKLADKKFRKQFEVHYYEINRYQEVTPVSILNYLEETAISHSEFVGYGFNRLQSEGAGWVLNRWQLEMERYPLWNEKITVETWPSSFERFYATREFNIKCQDINYADIPDPDGQVIGRATSRWIFFNIARRRPARIPAEVGSAYGIDPDRVLDDPFEDLASCEEADYSKEFEVRKSDIDTNGHVNNARYVEWLMEVLPDRIYNTSNLRSLEIIYKKEVGGKSILLSQCKCDEQDHIFRHSILNKQDHAELAIAKTIWQERKK